MLTISGKRDGFGAQALEKVRGMAMCKIFYHEYIHSPFKRFWFIDDSMTDQLEAFLNLGHGYRNIDSLSELEKQFLVTTKIERFSNKCINLVFTPEFLKELKTSYFLTDKPPLQYNNDRLNIAIHIRRGFDQQEQHTLIRHGRIVDDGKYIEFVRMILEEYGDVSVHLFSTDGDMLNNILAAFTGNVYAHPSDENNEIITFHHLVMADILIPSPSSFSYLAAIYSDNIVYRDFLIGHEDNEMAPLYTWQIKYPMLDNRVDTQYLEEQAAEYRKRILTERERANAIIRKKRRKKNRRGIL